MFDLTSSKLLILAIVALLVVGPKDFPILLRTIGRYMGILRKHANEFRSQFDDAIREAELDQMREQVEKMSRDIEKSVREADAKLASEFDEAGRQADAALQIPAKRADRVVIAEQPAAESPAADAAGHAGSGESGQAEAAAAHTSGPGHDHVAAHEATAPAHARLPRPGALASGPTADAPAPGPAQPALAGDKRSA